MRREEPRTGRVADVKFQFSECWECDANVPEAPRQRHWFRSDSGLANETIDPKRATSLLYGIQVASVAVRRAMQNRRISDS